MVKAAKPLPEHFVWLGFVFHSFSEDSMDRWALRCDLTTVNHRDPAGVERAHSSERNSPSPKPTPQQSTQKNLSGDHLQPGSDVDAAVSTPVKTLAEAPRGKSDPSGRVSTGSAHCFGSPTCFQTCTFLFQRKVAPGARAGLE